MLTVTAVTEPWRGVPKGNYKSSLAQSNRIKKIQLNRTMTAKKVSSTIVEAFKHLPISKYNILSSNRKGALSRDKNQNPSGEDLLDGVVRRKAVLYIHDQVRKCLNLHMKHVMHALIVVSSHYTYHNSDWFYVMYILLNYCGCFKPLSETCGFKVCSDHSLH